jgi:hypothetical protein
MCLTIAPNLFYKKYKTFQSRGKNVTCYKIVQVKGKKLIKLFSPFRLTRIPLKGLLKSNRINKEVENLQEFIRLDTKLTQLLNKQKDATNKKIKEIKNELENLTNMYYKKFDSDDFLRFYYDTTTSVLIYKGIHVYTNKKQAIKKYNSLHKKELYNKKLVLIPVKCNTNDLVAYNDYTAVFTQITIPDNTVNLIKEQF